MHLRSDVRRAPEQMLASLNRVAALEALGLSTDLERAADSLERLLADLGFTGGFAFGTVDPLGSHVAGALGTARGPLAEAAASYVAAGLVRGDPIARRLLRRGPPFSFSAYFRAPANRTPCETRAEVIANLRAHGIVTAGAMSLPIPGAGRRAALTVAGPPDDTQPAFDTRFGAHLGILRLAALHLGTRVSDILAARNGDRLTAMEREVLSGLARGLRPAEIAAACGKSVNTIQNQIASARTRLGARSATEAVARAIRTGQLDA